MSIKQKIYEGLKKNEQKSYHELTDGKKDEYMCRKMEEIADKELKDFEEKIGFKFTKKQKSDYVENMKAKEDIREYKEHRQSLIEAQKMIKCFLGFD